MEAVQFLFLNYYWIAVLINYLKCDVIVWGRGGGGNVHIVENGQKSIEISWKTLIKNDLLITLLPSFITWSKMVLFILLYKYTIMVGRCCLILFFNKVQNTIRYLDLFFWVNFFKTYLLIYRRPKCVMEHFCPHPLENPN